MEKLAIIGHLTRGREIIEIFKMLGGKEVGYSGLSSHCYYYIDEYGNIAGTTSLPKTFAIYTLKEFLEKFPYKIGNKVTHSDYESPLEIVGMKWENNSIKYEVYTNDYGYWFSVDELQPYKEKTMEEEEENFGECIEKTIQECLFGKEETRKEIKIDIPKGYEFTGIDDDNQKVVFTRIQSQYPKTFIEVLNFWQPDRRSEDDYQRCYKKDLIEKFQDLLYARDAYWTIYGEENGLGKPWEPDWDNLSTNHEFIKISKGSFTYSSRVLVFPTTEMRDAFYENFKELIEQCSKELL